MWHVSSCSGVANLRTAIHLLLTYLLTSLPRYVCVCGLPVFKSCSIETDERFELGFGMRVSFHLSYSVLKRNFGV